MIERTSEGAPKEDRVGGHEDAASGVLRAFSGLSKGARRSIRSYNPPKTSVSLVGLLVESLVLGYLVFGVDEAVPMLARVMIVIVPSW